MRYFILLIYLVIFSAILQANPKEYKKQIKQADDLIAVENYEDAIDIYRQLLVSYPDDDFIRFKTAECYLFSESHLDDAIELLKEIIRSFNVKKEKVFFVETLYYLGEAYHLTYQFQNAIDTYNLLLENWQDKEEDAVAKVEREINYCKNAIELCKDSVEFKITNLGSEINSAGYEHSPVVSLDENMMLFTSNKSRGNGVDNEDVFMSVWRDGEWNTPQPVKFNDSSNNATVSLSPDGRTLILYKNIGDAGNLYYSEFKNDEWGEITKFPEPINSGFRETHASLSLDGNTIYFSSDRPGGFGGKDIYVSRKLPDGNWGEVVNLGPDVNTALDEDSPFVQANDSVLYFSSEAHNSMGGFDIFKATIDENNEWGQVSNIGNPINTPFDDIFYNPTVDGQRVYYASKRGDGYGGTDIYLIEYPDEHENSLTVVAGYIYLKAEDPAVDAKITLLNKSNNSLEGSYRVNPNTGKYILILPANEKFSMVIETEGYKSVRKSIKVPGGRSYSRRGYSYYLDPITLKKIH